MSKQDFQEFFEYVLDFDFKQKFKELSDKFAEDPLNILFAGVTGAGKSSTINALFGEEVSKVGINPNPETKTIDKYELGSLILWDSPGLGETNKTNEEYSKLIAEKLVEKNKTGDALIDLVIVILNGADKNTDTPVQLINRVILPALDNDSKRLLIAINKTDIAEGDAEGWDKENSRPDNELQEFMKNKCQDIRNRIKEDTGVDTDPFYYCAGHTSRRTGKRSGAYNMAKFLSRILEVAPTKKRVHIAAHLNEDKSSWRSNEDDGFFGKIINKLLDKTIEEVGEIIDIVVKRTGRWVLDKIFSWL